MLQQTTENHLKFDILSHEKRQVFFIVNFVFLCTIICLFGIVANIINIKVFITQGFDSTINICFFGLAISDLCCLITLQWICICLNPLLVHTNPPWVPEEFQYFTAAWPHVISGRITSYITVYVTGERCLCLLAPLKVKQIITPLRTTIAVCLIYILNILTLVPEYSTSFLEWKFFPELNKTLLSLAFRGNREETAGIIFFLSFVTGVTSFVAVIVTTAVLIAKLKQVSNWRQKVAAGSEQSGSMSARDKKTLKLITMIAVCLIVCYTPGAAVSMVTFVEPEFDIGRRYSNTVIAMWSISCVFQAFNSCSNILLYYKMSSKYRHTFLEIFNRKNP